MSEFSTVIREGATLAPTPRVVGRGTLFQNHEVFVRPVRTFLDA